ncbi:MAG: hypothetical protein IIU42_07035 [Ruminococcus sp.]|nr:hypothetical protein [Ruminococcus sp.]
MAVLSIVCSAALLVPSAAIPGAALTGEPSGAASFAPNKSGAPDFEEVTTEAQLNSALDMLFKYVKTDLTRMEILSYGVQGLTNGWLNYEVQQTTIADDDVFKTGYVGSASVVFIDFELAAQRIQTAIYGDSNITLADDRVIPFRLVSRIS